MKNSYINYYGIPCLCTIIKDGFIKTVAFKSDLRARSGNTFQNTIHGYSHKDFLEVGFVYYEGSYIKNVDIEK